MFVVIVDLEVMVVGCGVDDWFYVGVVGVVVELWFGFYWLVEI